MSMYFREHGDYYFPEYERPGRTKQSFKDSTDINNILAKAQKTGVISHLAKHGGEYGDFSDMPDLLEAQVRMARGREIFEELPSEIRREFNHSPAEFFEFVNDPANADKLEEVLPELAQPGRQRIDLRAEPDDGAPLAPAEPETPPEAPTEP